MSLKLFSSKLTEKLNSIYFESLQPKLLHKLETSFPKIIQINTEVSISKQPSLTEGNKMRKIMTYFMKYDMTMILHSHLLDSILNIN